MILKINDDFWREVRLLAKNNYGTWYNEKETAKAHIRQAIQDILTETEMAFNSAPEVEEIAKEMCSEE